MKKLSAVTVPDSKLLEITSPVTSFGNELENQVKLMREFLSTQDGIGLAANQVGFNNRVIIVEYIDKDSSKSIPFQVFINPQIVECSEDKDSLEEGCLSVPQIELPVERSKSIKIRAQNIKGKKIKLTAKGLLGRIIQHETDHLNGLVFTMRIKDKLFRDFPELKNLNITFFGSGHFALPILEGLILLGLNIKVVTESPKPQKRSKELVPTPISQIAREFKKKYYEITSFDSLPVEALQSDLIICADFGKIIPENILKSAKIAALNFHPSLLPKYRGPSPIKSAILQGEKETGVTIINMSSVVDQGPIFAQIKTEILPQDNTLTLESRLSTLSLKLLFEVLPKLVKDEMEAIPQNEKEATFTKKLLKSDGEINWKKSPNQIERQIRAFYPWPGSYTFIDGTRLIVHQAHLEKDHLVLDVVQKEGSKPMSWKEFLRGFKGQKPDWIEKVKL